MSGEQETHNDRAPFEQGETRHRQDGGDTAERHRDHEVRSHAGMEPGVCGGVMTGHCLPPSPAVGRRSGLSVPAQSDAPAVAGLLN